MRLLALIIGAASLHAGVLEFAPVFPPAMTEGLPFNGFLDNLTDSSTTDTAASFTGTINWGDGTQSTPTFTGSNGSFNVNGAHTYAEEGTYLVAITADQGGNSAMVTGIESVNDAPLLGTGSSPFGFTPNVALTNILLMTFTDGNPNAPLSDFSATINWGDGTDSSGGVSAGVGNIFDVTGSHTYAKGGTYTVATTVNDIGGSSTSSTTTGTGNATPEPGTIGMVCAGLALVGWKRMRRA
jgi:PKD repeat protein